MLRPGSGRHRKDGVRVNNDKEAAATAPFPLLPSFPVQASRVYPRVGGGNAVVETENGLATGLSPRGRGKLHCETRRLRGYRSIPAWAGKRQSRLSIRCFRRSIPSWAGETPAGPLPPSSTSVYPRVGGGNQFRIHHYYCASGLSPRGRGKLARSMAVAILLRSIPAWAGETWRKHPLP